MSRQKWYIGEGIAERYLHSLGYEIIGTNFTVVGGEIDIIAEQDGEIHFVEVKYRRGDAGGHPEESLDDNKIEHMVTAAEVYCEEQDIDPETVRFHLLGIHQIGDRYQYDLIEDIEMD